MSVYAGNMINRSELVRAWLQSPPPPPRPVVRYGVDCDERGCHTTCLGATDLEAFARLSEHAARNHAVRRGTS